MFRMFLLIGAMGLFATSAQAVSCVYTGLVHQYTVDVTGLYKIDAFGAAGGARCDFGNCNGSGGYGAGLSGEFALTKGEILIVGVGGRIQSNSPFTKNVGGGGSLVVNGTTPLIVAGGGGGGGGAFGANGGNGRGLFSQSAGLGGAGGNLWITINGGVRNEFYGGGGGGGYFSDGSDGSFAPYGGLGGAGFLALNGGGSGYSGGGGGGGFDGGAGGDGYMGGSGGTSFNSGSNQLILDQNSGNGRVEIEFLAASSVPDPSSWILMLAGFGIVGTAIRRKRGERVAFNS